MGATRAGQRQLVLVTGEAGIGKTTLVERFVAARTRDAGGCCSTTAEITTQNSRNGITAGMSRTYSAMLVKCVMPERKKMRP